MSPSDSVRAPEARIGKWELLARSGEMYFNADACQVLGVDVGSFVPSLESLLGLFSKSAGASLTAALTTALADGTPFDLELSRRAERGLTFLRFTGRSDFEGAAATCLFGTVQDVTEQRLFGEALRSSEARYRLLVENSRDLIVEAETEGRIVFASPAFLTMLGLDPVEILGSDLLERVHPEDRSRVRSSLQEPAACFEFRYRRVDGRYVSLEANARRFSTLLGDEHCLAICRDITERSRMERLSRESMELFVKAFRASPHANFVTDVETGELLEANEGFTSFTGYTREEGIGRTTVDLGIWAEPRDRRRFVDELQRVGFVREFRARLRIRRGDERTCLLSAETVIIGGRSRMIGLVVDVTERDKAEQALRESEEKFSKAFRMGPHAMAIADLETREFIDINEGFESYIGRSRSEIIGRHIGDFGLVPAEERERLFRLLEAEGSFSNVSSEVTTHGETRWALLSAETTELRGRQHLIFSYLDISDQKRTERAKAELEDQLRHVQKMEAIGTLAGGIAHDFNNILGAMLAYTDLAKLDAVESPAVLESLGEIKKAGGRAKDLVQQILMFSRRAPNQRRIIRLEAIVAEASKLLRSTLPSTIELVSALADDVGTVSADATQMHQILVNLCTNAAHAMKTEPGKITIELSPHRARRKDPRPIPDLRAGHYVRLSVKDTGHGMDAATLERIYEPFFTTKKPGEGTGLGLSVVHGIVKDHGGTIHVESEPGRGTIVSVFLPLETAPAEGEATKATKIPLGDGERILFIDDEPLLCSGAKKLLERLNYVVTAETSAIAAVARFKTDPAAFDLVITDLTMPGMSGVDVAAELLRVRPGTPVILATGFSANLTADASRALGIRELVVKPLSITELAQTVKAVLHPE